MKFIGKKAEPMIRTTVTISPEFYKLAKENRIQFTEAVRAGISILLAEKGIKEYDNKLNIYRKMLKYQEELETALKRLYEIEAGDVKEIEVEPLLIREKDSYKEPETDA